MSDTPLIKGVYKFHPLRSALRKAEQERTDAERRLKKAESIANEMAREAEKWLAQDEVDVAVEKIAFIEAQIEEYGADVPTYLLRIPTYRSRGQFSDLLSGMKLFPQDGAMIRALQAAAKAGLVGEDDARAIDGLARATRGAARVTDQRLAAEIGRLAELVSDSPDVVEIRRKRASWFHKYTEINVRFHLNGWEGGALGDFPGVVEASGTMADVFLAREEVLDLIPPDHIEAINEKIGELGTLQGRQAKN